MNLDQQSRVIFNDLKAGRINRQEFVDAYDALFTRIPEKYRKNLERRMDRTKNMKGRTLGRFALMVYDTTIRETELVNVWVAMMLQKGEFSELYIESSGVDNSGLLLIEVNTSRADFIIHAKGGRLLPDGQYPIEIKFCPTLTKLTYKVDNLNNYIKSNSYVLTIISPGQVGGSGDPNHSGKIDFDSNKFKWVLFSPPLMQRMLNEIEVKWCFEMGNKPCVQLLAKDFDKYFEIQEF